MRKRIDFFDMCPNCNSLDVGELRGFEEKFLSMCSQCHFIFDRRIPTLEELRSHYGMYSYYSRKPCHPATKDSFNRVLDSFEPWRKTGRLLDVGCGQGDFLQAARNRGWNVYGTEFSPAAVRLCRVEGLAVFEGALSEEIEFGSDFDIVTSFEVFEHINSGRSEIVQISKRLRSGGLFYLTTPNFNALLRHTEKSNFKMISYPEHISFYTPKSIESLAQSAHFKILKVSTTGLSPERLKSSVLRSNCVSSEKEGNWRVGGDELREAILSSRKLRVMKGFTNWILDCFGLGDTLKVWMIKQ